MQRLLPICMWLFSIVLLASCAETKVHDDSHNIQACDRGEIRITADFESSRMDECANMGNNNFLITLKPENTPINHSPWYAFKIVAEKEATIKIAIKVAGGRTNRYLPKISNDMTIWRLHTHQYRGDRLEFSVEASKKAIYIAGQEVINNQYYDEWAKHIEQVSTAQQSLLGESIQGRPIYKLESVGESDEWLVILGRLHPPEVTGALALFPFVETLLANNQLAGSFRKKYNLLIIPNLNPDGVAMGNWRHNANGVDLNRDWITFKQKETKLVHQYLQNLIARGQKVKFAVDFHSTQEDVFYTMPVDYGLENRYFVNHWLDSLDKAMPNFNVIQKPGNRPNTGVSKQYFADNYNVHAITYEMGDESNRENIKTIAHNAAVLLMQNLLSDIDHNQE